MTEFYNENQFQEEDVVEVPEELQKRTSVNYAVGSYLFDNGDPDTDYWAFPAENTVPISKSLSDELSVNPRTVSRSLNLLEENGLAESVLADSGRGNITMRVNERLSELGRTVIKKASSYEEGEMELSTKKRGHNYSNYSPEVLHATLKSIYSEIALLTDEVVDNSRLDELIARYNENPFHVKNDNIASELRLEIEKAHNQLNSLIQDYEGKTKKGNLSPNQLEFIRLHHEIEGYMYVSGEEIPHSFLDIDPTKLSPEALMKAIGKCKEILSRMEKEKLVNPFELVG